jgi:hypothetical protein
MSTSQKQQLHLNGVQNQPTELQKIAIELKPGKNFYGLSDSPT